MNIFDTHAHYDDDAFDEDREKLIESMKSNNISLVMNVGASIRTTMATVGLTKQYDFIYGAAGVHPSETAELEDEENYERLKKCIFEDKIKAVGEIGLDYHWETPSKEIQKKHFERQLNMAREYSKPVIIHSRDAAADTFDMMKSLGARDLGGIIHCFSYGIEMAKQFLDMGFYLGIGGVLTFKNAKKLKEVVEYAPLDRLVIETDSPYLSPEPYRGKRNCSLYLPYVVSEMARLKNTDEENIARTTFENGLKVYGIQL